MAIDAPPREATPPEDRPAPIDRFIELQRRKRELEALLDPVKKELAGLEERVAAEFLANGTEQIKRTGATVYLSRDVQLKAKEGTAEAVQHLLDSGMADMLMASSGKLKAYVKEAMHDPELGTWEIDPRKLPREIAGAFEVSEIRKARCRMS